MEDLDIKHLEDIDKIGLTSYNIIKFKLPFEIKPKNFIEFAKADLKSKSIRSLINALSNTKRALDCQLDGILYTLGYYKESKKLRWNFIDKLEFLEKLNIVSPVFLKKINRNRNLLEHEFKCPEKEDVEEAIDITDFFIHHTDIHINKVVNECTFTLNKGTKGAKDFPEIFFDRLNSKFMIRTYKKIGNEFKEAIISEFTIKDKEYLIILKAFANYNNILLN